MNDEYPKQYLYRQIVRAKLFIDENYCSPIDLNAVADRACFSKYHFIRLFKTIYGKTPHQHLTSLRIDRAKELLANNISVKRVCFDVGFSSLTSFTGLFKRRIGKSPAAFQREQIRIRGEIRHVPLKHIPNCFAEKKGWTKNSNFREIETVDPETSVRK